MLAWNIERLRREKLPKFGDLIPRKPMRQQSIEEQAAMLDAILAPLPKRTTNGV